MKNITVKFLIKVSCIFIFVIFLLSFFIKSDKLTDFNESKEFRVELKNVNISYFYYGFGDLKCSKESNILISTLSRPNAFGQRMQIRNSWKKDITSKMTHKFFIGTVEEDERITEALKKESLKFGDIVFTSLIDSYLNLTLKMNTVYQFQQNFCPKVEYFLKVDEDTVLDVARFQYWSDEELNTIGKILNDMAIFGFMINKNSPLKNVSGKRNDFNEGYSNSKYPEYIHGSCYLMPTTAVKAILEEAKRHKHTSMDDLFYNGIVAEAAGITIIDTKKHFGIANSQKHPILECDESGRPFLFSISHISETKPERFEEAVENLKSLNCSK